MVLRVWPTPTQFPTRCPLIPLYSHFGVYAFVCRLRSKLASKARLTGMETELFLPSHSPTSHDHRQLARWFIDSETFSPQIPY